MVLEAADGLEVVEVALPGPALAPPPGDEARPVDLLVERGFIRRGQGKDLRSNGLYLTARGGASLKTAVAVLQREDQMLSAALAANERRELLRLLTKVRDNLRCDEAGAVNE